MWARNLNPGKRIDKDAPVDLLLKAGSGSILGKGKRPKAPTLPRKGDPSMDPEIRHGKVWEKGKVATQNRRPKTGEWLCPPG
jgi:hypothetical protein